MKSDLNNIFASINEYITSIANVTLENQKKILSLENEINQLKKKIDSSNKTESI